MAFVSANVLKAYGISKPVVSSDVGSTEMQPVEGVMSPTSVVSVSLTFHDSETGAPINSHQNQLDSLFEEQEPEQNSVSREEVEKIAAKYLQIVAPMMGKTVTNDEVKKLADFYGANAERFSRLTSMLSAMAA